MRHPFSNTEYEPAGDGLVRVRNLDSGREGVFDRDGSWVSGDLAWADPHLARWVADKGERPSLASMRSSTPYAAGRRDKGATS